jgi:predicted GNAT family acetyltransferase
MKRVQLFEEFSANRVVCDNCGWNWRLEDGGDDVYVCHECGHDNSPILKESMIINENNLIKDFTSKAKKFFIALKEEGKETVEILNIIYAHVFKNQKMSNSEKEQVGEQLKDVLKTVGLTTIAVMPGGVIFAIIIKALKLQKHLFPSNFRYLNETYVLKDLEDEFNIKLDLYDNGKWLELSRIIVPKETRGSGIGSMIMQKVIDYADENNKKIYLTPSKDFGATSTSRLEKFYKEFEFVKNKYKDESRETMVRFPRKQDI